MATLSDFDNSARAASTTCSVSGRGISTPFSTWKSRPQNSCVRVMYWVGWPFNRSCR